MYKNRSLFLVSILLPLLAVANTHAGTLKIGDKAPDFTLQDENKELRTLASFGESKVVLFFYPADGSPHCTAEACSLRDGYSELEKNNITILGVSYDSPESHKSFKEKYALPFTLLSDETKNVADAYGAYRWYTWFAPKRMTFLIESGKIVNIFTDIDIKNQSAMILEAFGIK